MKIHSPSAHKRVQNRRSDFFFNYFTLGLDILFDARTQKAKKFVLHTNFPGTIALVLTAIRLIDILYIFQVIIISICMYTLISFMNAFKTYPIERYHRCEFKLELPAEKLAEDQSMVIVNAYTKWERGISTRLNCSDKPVVGDCLSNNCQSKFLHSF